MSDNDDESHGKGKVSDEAYRFRIAIVFILPKDKQGLSSLLTSFS